MCLNFCFVCLCCPHQAQHFPGNGAAKASLFDLNLTDTECLNFVSSCLHTPLEPIASVATLDNVDLPSDKTCWLQYGMCKNTPFGCGSGSATQFVKHFNRSLVDHSVKVGDLLSFAANEAQDPSMFFLGVCVKRPQSHILLHAKLSSDGFCTFARDVHGRLNISTSQQVFQQLLFDSKPTPFRVLTVEVWSYQVSVQCQSPVLRIEAVHCEKSFTVDLDQKMHVRKKHFKLPFGLSMPNKRKKNVTKVNKTKRKPAPKRQPKIQMQPDNNSLQKQQSQSTRQSTSSASSSSSSSSSDSGSDSSDKEPEEDNVRSVSKEARAEEKQAKRLIAEHDEARNAVQASVPPAITSVPPAVTSVPPAVTPGKTFFSKEIGLDDVGLAVSARSVCHFCGNKIAKADVRFSFFYSCLRPSKWVHETCLVHLAKRDTCIPQVQARLQALSEKHAEGGSSSSDGSQLALARAIKRTLESALEAAK